MTAIFAWLTASVGKKNRHKISYPSIFSAIRPVPHCEELPVPVFRSFSSCEDSAYDQGEHQGCHNEVVCKSESFLDNINWLSAPEPFSQTELNDLVCDLRLPKKVAEILVYSLKKQHLLDDSAKVSYFRKRNQSFVTFFLEQKRFFYFYNITGLLRKKMLPRTSQLNGDCFWIVLSQASNVFFYTSAIFTEEFPLVTRCI